MTQKLTIQEVDDHLTELNGWSIIDGKLHKEFEFVDFAAAFKFMSDAVPHIDTMNHHPEWSNVYNKVIVNLVTHDVGGVTMNDINLAKILDSLVSS